MSGPEKDTRRPLTLIVAMTPYGVIGNAGKIPWHVPEDLRRFKDLTTGHAIIMGRKTWESIGRPLPNRANIIVSQTMKQSPEHTQVVGTIDAALTLAYESDKSASGPFVIGGAKIYAALLPRATRLEITYVLRNGIPGDTLFPTFEPGTHYPDVMTWTRTFMATAAGHSDVEYHTFVRRDP